MAPQPVRSETLIAVKSDAEETTPSGASQMTPQPTSNQASEPL